MRKIKLFLASSEELRPERERFEIEIYRKTKLWFDRGIFLHLDVWEDLSARMAPDSSQSVYDEHVRSADLFVLLGYTRMGRYTEQEFEAAFGQFKAEQKPFVFTYFKKPAAGVTTEASLTAFQQKLAELGHFYDSFADANDLWNQFNKELERLETKAFGTFERGIRDAGATYNQTADKIYNIGQIDKADFS